PEVSCLEERDERATAHREVVAGHSHTRPRHRRAWPSPKRPGADSGEPCERPRFRGDECQSAFLVDARHRLPESAPQPDGGGGRARLSGQVREALRGTRGATTRDAYRHALY